MKFEFDEANCEFAETMTVVMIAMGCFSVFLAVLCKAIL